MTPKTPSSHDDGSTLPPRHRPALGNLSKDTTEMDLWTLDDDLDLPLEPEDAPAPVPPRSSSRDIPVPRDRQASKPWGRESNRQIPPASSGSEDIIRLNVSKGSQKKRDIEPLNVRPDPHELKKPGVTPQKNKPESEFDELDHWEDVKSMPVIEPELEALPDEEEVEKLLDDGKAQDRKPLPETEKGVLDHAEVVANEMLDDSDVPVTEEETAIEEIPDIAQNAPARKSKLVIDPDDEFTPVVPEDATPISLRPHLGLSSIEKIGLIALAAILVIGGGVIYALSLHRLPHASKQLEVTDFPIKGALLTVASVNTYWRAPITEGADADTFRSGTRLLPVLEMKLSGGPAAVRVLFRNDDRAVVGDAVTRAVNSDGTLQIAATAGFDDMGMFAGYRTGDNKRWTIEVYEAPSIETPGKDFNKLFEINISTDLR